MSGWVARRFGGAIFVWLLISLIAFLLGAFAPGDPAELILLRAGGDQPSAIEVRQLRHQLGLDRPFAVRYAAWLSAAVRGDFGNSYRTGRPVVQEIGERLPATLALAVTALLLGLVFAIPLAVLSAAWRDTSLDHAARVVALLGVSVPSFWLAYVLMLLFAVKLSLFPVAGAGGLHHLVLPAVTLAFGGGASVTRLLRATLLDELGADYVRTARAKGLPGWLVLMRHALRNALNPIVTVSAIRFGRLLGEAVIVETVFGWPGVGRWMIETIYDRDYPGIQGFVIYIATVFIVINAAVDLAYRALDPRVRTGNRMVTAR